MVSRSSLLENPEVQQSGTADFKRRREHMVRNLQMDRVPRAFLVISFLAAVLCFIRITFLAEDYNEAVLRLELSGIEQFPFPSGAFLGDLYAETHHTLGEFSNVLQIFIFSDTHPPVHILTLWSWAHLFGSSLLSLRMFSLLAFLGGAYFCYRALSHYSSRLACCLAPLLFSVPQVTGEILRCRNYALAFLFLQLAFLSGVKTRKGQENLFLLFTVASGLAFSTHYLCIFFVLPLIVWVLILRREILSVKLLLGGALLGLLSASAGLLSLSIQNGSRLHQFSGFPGLEKEFLAACLSAGEHFLGESLLSGNEASALTFLLLSGLSVYWIRRCAQQEKREEFELSVLVTSCLFCTVFGLLTLDCFLNKAILSQGPSRYWSFLGILPFIPIFALSLESGERRLQRFGPPLLLALFLPIREASQIFSPSRSSTQRREVLETCDEKDLIIIGAGYGRGNPGRWIDLLSQNHCRAPIMVLGVNNEEVVKEFIHTDWAIEFLPSGEPPTRDSEQRIKMLIPPRKAEGKKHFFTSSIGGMRTVL